MIEPRSRYLRELEVGQECGISFVDLKVDKQGFCYLNPSARISPKANMLEVAVKRDTTGYHVGGEAIIWTTVDLPTQAGLVVYPVQEVDSSGIVHGD